MAVYKDKNGTWYVSARYTNWKGEADRKVKRGFQTKREAAECSARSDKSQAAFCGLALTVL